MDDEKQTAMDERNTLIDQGVWEREDITYTAADGRRFPKSLAGSFRTADGGSCMSCHSNKDAFCDRCHGYLAVEPQCWNCHVEPKRDH